MAMFCGKKEKKINVFPIIVPRPNKLTQKHPKQGNIQLKGAVFVDCGASPLP